jgi:hypothetical protein
LTIDYQEEFMTTTVIEKAETDEMFNTTEPYCTDGEIERLAAAFEACTLPKPKWTHQAHLTVALVYCLRYSADEALSLIRQRIKRYNEAVGGQNSATSGYHETITVFYMWAVRQFIESASPEASLVELANALIGGKYAAKSFPFEYYSRDLLLSSQARAVWVEPDLKAL